MRHEGYGWEIRCRQMDGDQTLRSTLFTTPSSAAVGDHGTGSGSVPPWAEVGRGWGHSAHGLRVSQWGWTGSPLLCSILAPSSAVTAAPSAPIPSHPIPPQGTGLETPAAAALALSTKLPVTQRCLRCLHHCSNYFFFFFNKYGCCHK